MNDERRELCEKLNKLHGLWAESENAKQKKACLLNEENQAYGSLRREANRQKLNIIKSEEEKINNRPILPIECYIAPPRKPEVSRLTPRDVMLTGMFGLLMYFAIAFFIVAMIMCMAFQVGELAYTPILLVTVLLMLPWLLKGVKNADVLTYEERCKEREEKLAEWEGMIDAVENNWTRERFYEDWCDFDSSFWSFLRTTEVSVKNFINEYNEKEHSLYLEYQKKKNDMDAYILKLEKELEAIGLLSPLYYYLALKIRVVLESGRADTIKEALNIAIEDERREKEAEERREEARRQEEILRNQADEARRHNQAMEDAAREQNEIARESQQESARHNREMEKNAWEQKNKVYGNSICFKCINYPSCSGEFVKRTGTCGAFRARS